MNSSFDQEVRYRLLKLLTKDPNLTQREMAKRMGISLGKLNYCLTELIKKGFVKTKRFSSSTNKLGYMYLITAHGLEENAFDIPVSKKKIQ